MENNEKNVNPLSQFMRQPKIYIKLPSKGQYWPKGSLIQTESGEYPVYSMTAKDELLLKVPDALLNGQAVVDIIQNCIPNIKNAWDTPSLDIDLILIAIRIATYGEKMSLPVKLKDDFELEYEVDLRTIIDQLTEHIHWDPIIPINPDLTVYVKPLNYKSITESAIQTFETQKIIQIANDQNMEEENKLLAFKESFYKLTNVTINIVNQGIYRVDTSAGSTENPKYIKEWINNMDKEIFDKIQQHTEQLRINNNLKPMIIETTEEMRANGVTEDTIEVPLVFDPANFFA